jgi:hypothetical protein
MRPRQSPRPARQPEPTSKAASGSESTCSFSKCVNKRKSGIQGTRYHECGWRGARRAKEPASAHAPISSIPPHTQENSQRRPRGKRTSVKALRSACRFPGRIERQFRRQVGNILIVKAGAGHDRRRGCREMSNFAITIGRDMTRGGVAAACVAARLRWFLRSLLAARRGLRSGATAISRAIHHQTIASTACTLSQEICRKRSKHDRRQQRRQ